MPSLQYMNRSAPFWDFVANLEQEGTNHPFFNQWAPPRDDSGNEGRHGPAGHPPPGPPPPFGPFGWGFPFGGGRGFPHHGPPPPPAGFTPPPHHDEHEEDGDFEKDFEKELNKEFEDDNEKQPKEKEDKEDKDNGEGPSGSGSETEGCCRRRGERQRGPCGSRRGRHGCGPRGPPHGPPPHHHGHHGPGHHGPGHHGPGHHGPGRRGGGWGGRGGGWGGWGRWNRGGPFGGGDANNSNPLSFLSTLFDASAPNAEPASEDFSPEADIFDTPSAFVVHVSLPGAKKEDVGVNWDVEKSELSIAGVIYRPGDEKFLEQLAMSERKVGAFERKVRLGTRANPANVDVDGISAKLEDGVLRVDVPKMGEGGFVEVKRVDVE